MGMRCEPRSWARRRLLGTLLLIGMLAACQTTPNQTPVASQVPTPEPTSGGPTATPATAAETEAPAASSAPIVPTSTDLIDAALAAGTIDAPTALLDRVYAFVGDPRLPAAFAAGVRAADDSALIEAAAALDTLPPAIRDEVLPFTLRPTDPRSPWNGGSAPTAQADRSNVQLASVQVASAAVCGSDGWASVEGKAPFTVWIRCGAEGEIQAEGVAQLLDGLWTPMTALMGAPIPDDEDGGVQASGVGRIDVYMVDECISRGGRCGLEIPLNALAAAVQVPPILPVGGAYKSSGYMVISGDTTVAFPELRRLLAHEFFHVLEFAHNAYAPFGEPAGWFGEASSKWAETKFAQDEAAASTPNFYKTFQSSGLSLQSAAGINEYASFTWPFFMQQERGEASVAAAWKALEGKVTPDDMNQAISSQLPFQDHFRDFAVRDLNMLLDPGNPIHPKFRDQDPALSGVTPYGPHRKTDVDLDTTGKYQDSENLPSLWASYKDITVQPNVRKVTLSFTGLVPAEALDVDVLVKIKDKGWERRKLTNGDTTFCRNKAADDVEEIWLVLSNHDIHLGHSVQGNYTMESWESDCAGFAIEWHYTEQWIGGLAGTDLVIKGVADVPDDPNGVGGGGGFSSENGTITGTTYLACPGWNSPDGHESLEVSNSTVVLAAKGGDGVVIAAGSAITEPASLLLLGGFFEYNIPLVDGVATRTGGLVIPPHAKGINLRGCGAPGTISWTLKVTQLSGDSP